jgi:tripartite-type tricarboxylate transporter receptor subunit TctC
MTIFLAMVLGLSLVLTGCGGGQKKAETKKELDWPKKAIQIIVPYNAGGDTDFNARTYAKYLEKELGKPVIVVNMGGSGGAIGSRKVKESAPDGYTVLMNHSSMIMGELSGVAEFGHKDFDIACLAGLHAGDIVTIKSGAPYKTMKELAEYSMKPGANVRIAGTIGSLTQLTSLMINASGAKLNVVDVGGASERLVALKGGHIEAAPMPYGNIKAYLDKGEFIALGVNTEKRNPLLPNIPTLKEQGYNSVVPQPYTFFFPKGTPKEIIEKFSKAVEKIAKTNNDYKNDIEKAFGQTPAYMNSADATKYFDELKATFAKHQAALKAKGK